MVQELDIKKLDGKSLDIAEADKEKLKAVFPQCFVEGKLDIDKLLSLCGEYIDNDFEKYKFEWKGNLPGHRRQGLVNFAVVFNLRRTFNAHAMLHTVMDFYQNRADTRQALVFDKNRIAVFLGVEHFNQHVFGFRLQTAELELLQPVTDAGYEKRPTRKTRGSSYAAISLYHWLPLNGALKNLPDASLLLLTRKRVV